MSVLHYTCPFLRLYYFQRADCQRLETFKLMKQHLEDLMARKTTVKFGDHLDFKAMILSPIIEWNTEATEVIERGTKSLMESFRLTGEAVQKSTSSVKFDIENDKRTKKT